CAGDERYAGFAIAVPPGTDTSKVLRTRNLPLLHEYETVRGPELLWTTFSRDQVDLNFANPRVLLEILDVLLFYAEQGAAMIRLDAVPYMWKKPGTTCAHLAETHELIRLMRDVCDAACPHVLLLAETNAPHRDNFGYLGPPGLPGEEAQLIYNFCLPPLVLWSLHRGDATHLSRWAAGLEPLGGRATYLNVTATHDGIGMRPTEGLLSEPERAELVALARAHGGDVTGKKNPDGSASPYELNLSYFDAVNDPRAAEPDALRVARFMCSQAIPLALAGIPGIYIHSLLGSRNDLEGAKRTGRARSINRAQLRLEEVRRELADQASLRARVLGTYRRLLEIRRRQSAFHPDAAQEVLDLGPAFFALRRTDRADGQSILAVHNVTGRPQTADLRAAAGRAARRDLLRGESFPVASLGTVGFEAYQVRWMASE
ncbi:MAG TPA: alpha-amylase family glycosyl hydrolase, partial [Planctomycetota bacterium]|nr:alpha-amylase family glycosyl hydrolase [Planctomycetota bacterium]